jgi:hypothetical protein
MLQRLSDGFNIVKDAGASGGCQGCERNLGLPGGETVMNIRQLRDLAIRLLGLYFVGHAILSLSGFVAFFDLSGRSGIHITSRGIVILGGMMPVVFYLLFACFLLFKSQYLENFLWAEEVETDSDVSGSSILAAGVSLVGLFFLLGSLGQLAAKVEVLGIQTSTLGPVQFLPALPDAVTVVLALLCTLKSKAIASFLQRRTE